MTATKERSIGIELVQAPSGRSPFTARSVHQ
jgi:hypothetical protein